MADALLNLQGAIYQALAGDSPPAVSCPVYTGRAKQSAAFPYIVIGEDTAADWGTKTETGQEVTVTVHTWSRSSPTSMKELKTIMAQIYAALHEQTFTVTGQALALCRFEFSTSFPDADDHTMHGVQRFRLYLTAD